MKLTRAHGNALAWWRVSPKMRVLACMEPPRIHELINSQVAGPKKREPLNALPLLALRIQNGDPVGTALLPSSWDAVNAKPRYYTFKRWRRRYLKAQMRHARDKMLATWRSA